MKVGIRTIRYIAAEKVGDYSFLPPGSSLDLAAYQDGPLQELPFTPESADLSENWGYDNDGKYSDATFSASIRADRENYRPVLQRLAGKKHIFEVERIDGVKCIIGSREFLPTFTYGDSLSGISSSSFSIKIKLKSLHGILFGKN